MSMLLVAPIVNEHLNAQETTNTLSGNETVLQGRTLAKIVDSLLAGVSGHPSKRVSGALSVLGRPAVPLLTSRLEAANDNLIKVTIAQALGKMGESALDAAPVLARTFPTLEFEVPVEFREGDGMSGGIIDYRVSRKTLFDPDVTGRPSPDISWGERERIISSAKSELVPDLVAQASVERIQGMTERYTFADGRSYCTANVEVKFVVWAGADALTAITGQNFGHSRRDWQAWCDQTLGGRPDAGSPRTTEERSQSAVVADHDSDSVTVLQDQSDVLAFLSSDYCSALSRKGAGYFTLGIFDSARVCFEGAVRDQSRAKECAFAYFLAGLCWDTTGHADSAANVWSSIPDYYPQNPMAAEAGFRAGEAYLEIEKYENACAALRFVMELYPFSKHGSRSQALLGRCYQDQKKYVDATREYQKFIDLFPTDPDVQPVKRRYEESLYYAGLEDPRYMEEFRIRYPNSELPDRKR
jgi:hypothetical protein